jgi:corrinoid protein of di/trimethylamine methyltransferase
MDVRSEILERLSGAVLETNSDAARKAATDALEANLDPLDAIQNGLAKGLREVGAKFERGEMFLMELIVGGEAMRAGLDVLKPEILKQRKEFTTSGKVVLGTVEGDMHDIGKSIVNAMLTAEGFDVIDLGVDIPDQLFVDKTRETRPHIIGLSALMTTTRGKQKDVIEALNRSRLRETVKVMVGGATVTPEWAQEIAADAYAEDGVEAARRAKELVKR